MALGLILGIGRAFRRKRTSSLDILTSKRSPKGFYKGKNCKPTGFHTRKEITAYGGEPKYRHSAIWRRHNHHPSQIGHGSCAEISHAILPWRRHNTHLTTLRVCGYVVVPEKLPNYVVPNLTGFKLTPYVSQCAREGSDSSK
ncbi:hypothetical protein CASFOL_023379 [Castilleja foliolosa]|uniref:Ribosomal protein L2 n=1 Tax=Castilleja foliolosa TaxID=1961234 RepID=A0ABD3CKF7_9LAMI